MKHSTKQNVAMALFATAVSPWTYPLVAASRQNINVSSEVPDISVIIASRERGRPIHATGEGTAALDASRMLGQIRASTHADRMHIASTVESAVDAASHAVKAHHDSVAEKPDANREQLQEAVRKAATAEAQVRGSLQALRASTPDTHAEARDKLASDYEGYASAVADVEAIDQNVVGAF